MNPKFFLALAIVFVLGIGILAGAGIFYFVQNTDVVYAQTGTQPPAGRDAGILVGAVTPDSPSAKAGIVRGDIILEANGKAVNQPVELNDIVRGLKAGDKLTLSVLHGDATRSVEVTVGDQNGQAFLGLHPAVVVSGLGERFFGRGPGGLGKALNFKGALVTSVSADGPAAKAGIQVGDQILSVNGKAVDASNDLAGAVQALKPGDVATLSVQKKGEANPQDVKVTLGDDPKKAGTAYLGLSYKLVASSIFNGQPGVPPLDKLPRAGQVGVWVSSVAAGSPAEKAGLKAKDLITAVNGKAITMPDELSSLVKAAKAGDTLSLTVTRAGEQNPLTLNATLAASPENASTPYLGITMAGLRQLPQIKPVLPTPKAPGASF